jgi:2-iminobutanoate/2-iminopropanoate deaminase
LSKTDRRSFLAKSAAAAAATAAVGATGATAAPKSVAKRVLWTDGKVPEKQQMFAPAVAYGNLLFLSGIGAHVPGDIKSHTKIVLDEIQKKLEAAGSSMEKVLKAQVYLADINDYKGMNEVFLGRFGAEPPVRTTTAAAGIPGKSLVEIDVIAYI